MDLSILIGILFIFGLIVGSFLNVVVLRLPEEESLSGRSHCPHCKTTLQPIDLVPVVSYLLLRGHCRYCKAGISIRYPILELITGVLFAVVPMLTGIDVTVGHGIIDLVFTWVVIALAIAVFVIDFEYYLILDTVVVWASVLLLVLLGLKDVTGSGLFMNGSAVVDGLLGAAAGVAFLGFIWLVSKGQWMGLGDVKFMVPFGLALGFPESLAGIFLAFFMGSVVAVPLLMLGIKKLKARVPFGTFLSVSLLVTLMWGSDLVAWYLQLIGIQ